MDGWVDYIVKRVEREGKWAPAKRGKGSAETFQDTAPETDKAPEEVIEGVVSNRVSHTHTTSLGPVLAGLHFWEKLGMPKLLETVPHETPSLRCNDL